MINRPFGALGGIMARTIEGKEKKKTVSFRIEPAVKERIEKDFGSFTEWLKLMIKETYGE